MSRCDRIVTVSKAVASLIEHTGHGDRVRVVYNGVNLEGFTPGPGDAHEVGENCGRTGGTPLRVGIFGLVSDRKNQLVVAEAVARVVKSGRDVRLLVAGDAFGSSVPYGERLRSRLAEADLLGRALWLPFQKDVPTLYRSIDINILVSKEEGFGRTIVEAGAMGIPSIGSRIGGIPELIRDGETGWLVDEGSVEQLAEAITQAADAPERLRRGSAAQKLVTEQFTIQAHARHMIQVWEEAIEVAARRRRSG